MNFSSRVSNQNHVIRLSLMKWYCWILNPSRKRVVMNLFMLSHQVTPARLYLAAPDLLSALQLILERRKSLAESHNPIVTDLVAVTTRDRLINEFVMDVNIDRFSMDRPNIFISDIPDGYFDIISGSTVIPDDELIAALQQLGGIYEPFVLPHALQTMKARGEIGNTLVMCHGRSSRQLSFPGFDPTTAWFVDRDRKVNPDIVASYEDLPLDEMPKFRRVIFVYCPLSNQPGIYMEALNLAKEILIPGGVLIYALPVSWDEPEYHADRKEFEQVARQNGWRQQPSINLSIDDTTVRGAVFIKPTPPRKTPNKR
jgi:hypothetical protein